MKFYNSIQISLQKTEDGEIIRVSVLNNGAEVAYIASSEKEVDIVKDCFVQIGDMMDSHLSKLPSPTQFKFED